jgi:hypothetical protein
MGYVYRIGKGGLEYVTEGGKGLSAFRHASGTLISTVTSSGIVTHDESMAQVPAVELFGEKCALHNTDKPGVFCASPREVTSTAQLPDDWYKGVVGFNDELYVIDTVNVVSYLISDLSEESGRPIDVLSIGTNTASSLVYFINKYDGALWVLDLSRSPASSEQIELLE